MDIQVRTRSTLCEIEVMANGSTITESLMPLNNDHDSELPNNLITAANDIARFKGVSDVDFVLDIFNAFLNDSEKEAFMSEIKTK